MQPKRRGNWGWYFMVLKWLSENGLSLDVCGRLWDLVTPRSASRSKLSANIMLSPDIAAAQCRGDSGPGGPCSSGPGGGLSSGPGGGLYSGRGGGLYSGPGGGLYSGPCMNPYRSNHPPREQLL